MKGILKIIAQVFIAFFVIIAGALIIIFMVPPPDAETVSRSAVPPGVIFDNSAPMDILPEEIQTAINLNGNGKNNSRYLKGRSCALLGKPINLSIKEEAETSFYAVTTLKPCAWREENAPIWIVQKTADRADVLMQSYGATLSIEKRAHMGLRDVTSSPDMLYSEERWEKSRWQFNGMRYVMIEGESPPF